MRSKANNYQEIFDNIPVAILILEEQYIVDANNSALKLFDMASKNELFSLHPSQLSAKYQLDGEPSTTKSNKMIEICLKEGEHSFEWLSSTLGGKEFLLEVNLKKILIDKKVHIQCTLKDIELIKELEKKLRNNEDLLVQKKKYIKKINNILANNKENNSLIETIVLLEE